MNCDKTLTRGVELRINGIATKNPHILRFAIGARGRRIFHGGHLTDFTLSVSIFRFRSSGVSAFGRFPATPHRQLSITTELSSCSNRA
jgi:hypothetical protein